MQPIQESPVSTLPVARRAPGTAFLPSVLNVVVIGAGDGVRKRLWPALLALGLRLRVAVCAMEPVSHLNTLPHDYFPILPGDRLSLAELFAHGYAGPRSHAFPINTNKCSIGWDYAGQNFPFTGVLDELSFYKRALAAAEIQAIANAGSAGKCAGSSGGGTGSPPPGITSVTPPNAAPGSLVTIAGTNFGSNPSEVSVRCANSWGFVQSVSPTQIVVTVPFGISDSVPLTVAIGTQRSASVSFGIQASLLAQPQGRITSATLVPSNQVRLVVEPSPPDSTGLLLEAADSPIGPRWKEPEFLWNPLFNGFEFFTPLKSYSPERYYRFSLLNQSMLSVPTLPYIRFLSPNANVRPGLSVSLLGANFAPAPQGNAVRFELPGQTWAAAVTQAATNFLVITVPTNLPPPAPGTGTLYRVTVTTSQGTGNGVGCTVLQTTANTLMVRPTEAYINQPPGSGRQTLIVGGGVPPYHLVPQTTNDLAIAVATLNGVVLDIVANTNAKFGSISVGIDDSGVPFQRSWANVGVLSLDFDPTFEASFHTLMAGSAPGLTMTVIAAPSSRSYRIEKTELELQNVGLEVSLLQPGQIAALMKSFYSGTVYGFEQLSITEVNPGRAKFDVLSLAKGTVTLVAQGELIESPPTIVFNFPNLRPVALTPQPVHQELIFADDLLRLPAGVGQSFSLAAKSTSVSVREDVYLPQTKTQTRSFTTTGLATGAPRIDRLLPDHGEVSRNVRLRGAGFGPTPADNLVTFTAAGGTKVPAEIVFQTNGELVVTVPRDAITGPVQLTVGGKPSNSNNYLFFVRFHPNSLVLFDSFTNNLPTPLRLIYQQPVDEGETLDEVPIQSVTATLDQGRLAVTGLSSNQQVGVAIALNFYTGRQSTNVILYAGQESAPPQRHRFEVRSSPSSSYVLARLYALDDADGSGVTLQAEAGGGLFEFFPGLMWDYQFTSPIYRPPATPGADVRVRLETVSQPWMSVPDDRMRVIINSTRRVR